MNFFKSHYPRAQQQSNLDNSTFIEQSPGFDQHNTFGQFNDGSLNRYTAHHMGGAFELSKYTGTSVPGLEAAYFQPSFNWLNHHPQEPVRISMTEDKAGLRLSQIRNNAVAPGFIDSSYIQLLASKRRESQLSENRNAAAELNEERSHSKMGYHTKSPNEGPNKDDEDGMLNYDQEEDGGEGQLQSLNIHVPQTQNFMPSGVGADPRKSYNISKQPRQSPSKQLLQIRPEFRAQTSGQYRRRRIMNEGESSPAFPQLSDVVKMPKRLLPKAANQLIADTQSFYNCGPSAALIDKEIEERMSGVALRQSLMSVQKFVPPKSIVGQKESPELNGKRKLNSNFAIVKERLSKLKRSSTNRSGGGASGTSSNNMLAKNEKIITIDPQKVKEARDIILKISKIRVESQFNPYNYDYIDVNKYNSILIKESKDINAFYD